MKLTRSKQLRSPSIRGNDIIKEILPYKQSSEMAYSLNTHLRCALENSGQG